MGSGAKNQMQIRWKIILNDMPESLIRTHFSIGASNFACLSSKRVLDIHATLKMVKDLKAKDRHVARSNDKLEDKKMPSWKKDDYKSHLKLNNLACSGSFDVFKTRCYLTEDMSSMGMAC